MCRGRAAGGPATPRLLLLQALVLSLRPEGCRSLRLQTPNATQCSFGTFGSGPLRGVQVIESPGKIYDFVNFSHGSYNREGLFVYPEAKLAMCIIEKNGCTTWTTLFNKLTRGILDIQSPWYGVVPFHWSERSADAVFRQPDSTRIVWVREPLERFLSGFLNRCSVKSKEYERFCIFRKPGQAPGFPISQVKEWLDNPETSLYYMDTHFSPQAWHCELMKRLPEYNLIGLMTRGGFAHDAACILERAGLSYLNTRGPRSGRPFLQEPREGAAAQDAKTVALLKKFYTKELAMVLMNVFYVDYEVFHIERPAWVWEATGEWSDRRPASVAAGPATGGGNAGVEDPASIGDLERLAAEAGYI
mmetsp:Transcript_19045/g.59890  ORF Transcript_19045/g.59890 Transcript_19045/m.59890 type:complete len:360 (+) Transcript_19045:79-1158(+)